jgi:hypothetical protein
MLGGYDIFNKENMALVGILSCQLLIDKFIDNFEARL